MTKATAFSSTRNETKAARKSAERVRNETRRAARAAKREGLAWG